MACLLDKMCRTQVPLNMSDMVTNKQHIIDYKVQALECKPLNTLHL